MALHADGVDRGAGGEHVADVGDEGLVEVVAALEEVVFVGHEADGRRRRPCPLIPLRMLEDALIAVEALDVPR